MCCIQTSSATDEKQHRVIERKVIENQFESWCVGRWDEWARMKSVTADLQQKLYIFLQDSDSHYSNTTHLPAFTGLSNYLTYSECQGMNLQDDTHVCYHHWDFQAMIESWVLCVWTHQLRAKTHGIKHERQTHTHDFTLLMNTNMTTKSNHVIYELQMVIVRLSGFDSDSFTFYLR